jgi:hypothetical protein
MPPCAISGAQLLELIQYWWSSYRSVQLVVLQQNILPSKYTSHWFTPVPDPVAM